MIDRILIIGFGSIGKRHLGLARKLFPHADIRILRRTTCNKVPDLANGCFTTLEHAIEFSPQISIVASPATFHVDQAQRLLQSGVHVLIEKPLSASLEGVPQLLALSENTSAKLMVGYNLRFLSSLEKFRSLIKAKTVGRVLSVRCEVGQYLPTWRPGTDYREGVTARRELGGGILLELSHEIDYLRWAFGEIEWVQATLHKQSDLDIDVEDTAHLVFGLKSTGQVQEIVASLNMDFIRHDKTRTCTVIGVSGSMRWNGTTGLIERMDAGQDEWQQCYVPTDQIADSYLSEWKDFINSIENDRDPAITGEDGQRVLEVIAAARQSSDSGQRVHLSDHPSVAGPGK